MRKLDALEMFGADGSRHTLDYYPLVRSLEIWELDRKYLAGLRMNFPKAKVKITDAFREIQETRNTFDLLVLDGPVQVLGPRMEYCEHFELLSQFVFRVARRTSLIILTVVPDILPFLPKDSTHPRFREHLARRSSFYETTRPELVPIEKMVPAYRRVVNACGYTLDWHFSLRRSFRLGAYYFAMQLSRRRRIV